jgi:hypothetical protein
MRENANAFDSASLGSAMAVSFGVVGRSVAMLDVMSSIKSANDLGGFHSTMASFEGIIEGAMKASLCGS